jgi:P-type Mg2+ transporter
LTLTTLVIMAVGAWLPYSPFATERGMVPLPAVYWVWIAGFRLAYGALTHGVKAWFFNRFGGD